MYRLPTREIVTIFDDVTDRMKAGEEQRYLQEQLLVSQKMESIGAFAGGTAHNFRNILQAVSGNIEYLEMVHGDIPEIRELAKSIYDSIEKGVDLINSLLQFSKRDGDYQMVDVDLADVITKTYEIVSRVFNKNIEVQVNVGKNLYIRGNHSLLSQVFMNLFSNAKDAMPHGGILSIEARKSKGKIIAVVSDTGHGMDRETLEKIFDPFFTLKDVGKGTGLGLSTTHGIIEQHKGSIQAFSKPGKGATFEIYFPAVMPREVGKLELPNEIVQGKGEKVLIVDDERASLDSLTHLIQRLGYEVISEDSPIKALKTYSKWRPDVVIMDRNMPQMDGIACVKEIVKVDPRARIVILSGYEESGADGIDESVQGLIKGYLMKPCGVKALSQTLARVLQG
jgi:CheY-like chemotaxis protein